MYSPKIIAKVIDGFAAEHGWTPKYHSIAQVEDFDRYINSLIRIDRTQTSRYIDFKPEVRLTERRKADVRRWVENEQFLCFADCSYWETRYGWICDDKNNIFRYAPRKSQQIFDSILADFDEQQVAIELMVVKSRQVGISTDTVMKFHHRVQFIPNTQAVMASARAEQSDLLGRMGEVCRERQPFWLVPPLTSTKSTQPRWRNGSIMSMQSGSQAMGIAQGWTPTCLTATSLVRLHDGYIRKICDIDDERGTQTLDGRTVRILKAWRTSRNPQSTRILKIWGFHTPLECTPDHQIWTCHGWVEAGELSVGDSVRHPVKPITHTIRRAMAYYLPRGSVRLSRRQDFEFGLTPAAGYLSGFYLAEGSCHYSGIGKNKKPYPSELVFTIHQREIDRTVEAIKAVIKDGGSIRVKRREGKGAQVTVTCAWLARWMSESFGEKHGKCIEDWVWEAGREFVTALVCGYLDGDGHCERVNNTVRAPSICFQLPIQLRDLIASLGLGWCSIYKWAEADRCHEAWCLAMTGTTAINYRKLRGYPYKEHLNKKPHWSYDADGKNIDVKIESVSEGWNDEFWDVEVDDSSHSFATPQCVVHNCIHISEIADIPKPQKTLEEGLFPAAHSSRKLFFVLEGTGADATSWQAEKWRYYKANWGKGGRFFCVFIPFPCATDLYPPPDWLRKNPVPEGWQPIEDTRRMIRKAELYIRSTSYLTKVMGERWEMPKEQAWMWETKFREATQSHTLKVFLSQYPVSDDEAFQSKHDRAIGDDIIEVVSSRAEKKYQAYAITGNSVLIGQADQPYEPDPETIDDNQARIPVSWKSKNGQTNHWEMVPLKPFDDTDDLQCFNKVLIFKHPEEGQDYSIGVDTADGLGNVDEDRASAEVVLNRIGSLRDEQVAEFVSNLVNPPQMVSINACLAAYYGQWYDGRAHTKDPRGVKFCIEQRERYGDDCQFQLKLMGFTFHHVFIWYDKKETKSNVGNRLGWFTNAWSRPMLLNRFQDAVNGGWIRINSPMAIRQLATWVRKVSATGKSKLDHQSGQHDDNIMGLAQAYFTRHSHDVLVNREQLKYANPDEKLPLVSYEWCENRITV